MINILKVVCLFLFILGVFCHQEHEDQLVEECEGEKTIQKGKRIAIIGGGIGGSSAAHFIDEFLKERGIRSKHEIVIFEKTGNVGGRLQSINLEGIDIETGGSIYYFQNYIIRNFTLLNNFTEIGMKEEGTFGVWTGSSWAFKESPWKIVNIANVIWRYGLSPLTSKKVVEANKDKFLKLYPLLMEQKAAFESVASLLNSADLLDLVNIDTKSYLHNQGVSDLFLDELATAVTRINYGQNLSLHTLAGSVSLIASGDHLFHPQEGFSTVLRTVISKSNAVLSLNSTVKEISAKTVDGLSTYNVKYYKDGKLKDEEFEVVVVATPLEFADINFINVNLPPKEISRPFQVTHVTLIIGELNKSYFNATETDELPNTIGTIENPNIPFSSIAVKGKGKDQFVYKIFSRQELLEETLNSLFGKRTYTHRLKWNAYPVLKPVNEFPPIKIHDQLYYINALESALSVIEMSALGAKNVANLIERHWN